MSTLLKNWKTTLAGLIALLIQIGPIVAPKIITQSVANEISLVAGALGLVVSKDGNVTGVTK